MMRNNIIEHNTTNCIVPIFILLTSTTFKKNKITSTVLNIIYYVSIHMYNIPMLLLYLLTKYVTK